jgi:hypothetical protein
MRVLWTPQGPAYPHDGVPDPVERYRVEQGRKGFKLVGIRKSGRSFVAGFGYPTRAAAWDAAQRREGIPAVPKRRKNNSKDSRTADLLTPWRKPVPRGAKVQIVDVRYPGRDHPRASVAVENWTGKGYRWIHLTRPVAYNYRDGQADWMRFAVGAVQAAIDGKKTPWELIAVAEKAHKKGAPRQRKLTWGRARRNGSSRLKKKQWGKIDALARQHGGTYLHLDKKVDIWKFPSRHRAETFVAMVYARYVVEQHGNDVQVYWKR